jgi:hypothetical protein
MTILSQTADDYLRLRRSLGHKLADAGRLLPVSLPTWSPTTSRRSRSKPPWRGRNNPTRTRPAPFG